MKNIKNTLLLSVFALMALAPQGMQAGDAPSQVVDNVVEKTAEIAAPVVEAAIEKTAEIATPVVEAVVEKTAEVTAPVVEKTADIVAKSGYFSGWSMPSFSGWSMPSFSGWSMPSVSMPNLSNVKIDSKKAAGIGIGLIGVVTASYVAYRYYSKADKALVDAPTHTPAKVALKSVNVTSQTPNYDRVMSGGNIEMDLRDVKALLAGVKEENLDAVKDAIRNNVTITRCAPLIAQQFIDSL